MTSTPGSRKPAPKTKRPRPAPASPVQSAAQDARSNRGARLSALEARVGALASELKKSERRLQRETRRRERAESELRQSEARFQSLAAFGDHHLFVMDPQGRYLFSNREQGLSVGGERLPFVGRNQKDFHPRELAELYEGRMRAVLETGRAVEFEHVAPEPDGMHQHQDTLYPIEENGRIVALGGICRDVTDQKGIQNRLQHALDATAEGVWDWDIRSGDVVFSRNWKTSLGYSPDEVPDRIEFWESIVHPEDLPRVRQALDDHLAGRTPLYVCENRLRMKSGGYRANLDRGKVVERDASGQPLRMVGTDTDVSERRKAMDDLLQAKNDLEAVFNAIRQAVFLMEPEGRVVSANEEVARRLGCEVQDLVGRSIYEFLPPVTAAGRRQRVEEVLRSGRPVQFEDVRAGRTILQTVYPVFDSHGAVVRLAVYGQDVTEERSSEAALRESEERYRRIVETANEGVWAMDGAYVTTYVNRRMADMLGYRPGEMVGRRVDAFMFPEDLQDHSTKMAVRQEGGNAVYERRFRCKGGRELWTTVSATALKDAAGGFAGSFAMFTDITRRKRSEEILQARLRLSEAAGSLALEELLQQALDEAERITGSRIGFVHFVEADERSLSLQMWSTNTLRGMCTAEGRGRHYGVDEAGVWVDCIRERRPVIHNDYPALAHRKGLPAGHAPVARELVVPILRNERIVAVIGVGNKPQEYDAQDVEAVSALANLAWDVVLRKRAEAALSQSQAKLRDLYRQLQNAREEERCRISRELHDELGQNITALKIDLAWLARRVDPERPALRQKLDSMSGLVDATLDTVRRVSAELRPGVLDSLGLAAAAEWLVRDFQKRTEVACDIRITPDEIAVAPGLATDVFRILQETLTNVARHARASRVEVTLVQKADMLVLDVIDNGIGIASDRVSSLDSFGLLGIRERLLPHRATLRVEGRPGGGTAVRVAVPIDVKAD